jgi:hypothetical protein
MECNRLIVKFPWTLRRKIKSDTTSTSAGTSRSIEYNKRLKSTNLERYALLKQRDTQRHREAYRAIDSTRKCEKEEQRKKWKEAKQLQRQKARKRKSENQIISEPPRQKFKEMSADERREYYKEKKRIYRELSSREKKQAIKNEDRVRKRIGKQKVSAPKNY